MYPVWQPMHPQMMQPQVQMIPMAAQPFGWQGPIMGGPPMGGMPMHGVGPASVQQQQQTTMPPPPGDENPPLPPEPPPAPEEEESQDTELKPKDPAEEMRLEQLKSQAAQWQQTLQMQQQFAPPGAAPVLPPSPLDAIKKEEEEFNQQYEQWKKQYDEWREQNKSHPNKDQFNQYLQQWQTYERQMEEKRSDIQRRKKETQKQIKEKEKAAAKGGQAFAPTPPVSMMGQNFNTAPPYGMGPGPGPNFSGPPPPRPFGPRGMRGPPPPRHRGPGPRMDGPGGPNDGGSMDVDKSAEEDSELYKTNTQLLEDLENPDNTKVNKIVLGQLSDSAKQVIVQLQEEGRMFLKAFTSMNPVQLNRMVRVVNRLGEEFRNLNHNLNPQTILQMKRDLGEELQNNRVDVPQDVSTRGRGRGWARPPFRGGNFGPPPGRGNFHGNRFGGPGQFDSQSSGEKMDEGDSSGSSDNKGEGFGDNSQQYGFNEPSMMGRGGRMPGPRGMGPRGMGPRGMMRPPMRGPPPGMMGPQGMRPPFRGMRPPMGGPPGMMGNMPMPPDNQPEVFKGEVFEPPPEEEKPSQPEPPSPSAASSITTNTPTTMMKSELPEDINTASPARSTKSDSPFRKQDSSSQSPKPSYQNNQGQGNQGMVKEEESQPLSHLPSLIDMNIEKPKSLDKKMTDQRQGQQQQTGPNRPDQQQQTGPNMRQNQQQQGPNRPNQQQDGPNRPNQQQQQGPNRPFQQQDGPNRPNQQQQQGPNRPFQHQDGPNRSFQKQDGPNRPFQHQDGPNRPFQQQDGPNRPNQQHQGANRPFHQQDGPNMPNQQQQQGPNRQNQHQNEDQYDRDRNMRQNWSKDNHGPQNRNYGNDNDQWNRGGNNKNFGRGNSNRFERDRSAERGPNGGRPWQGGRQFDRNEQSEEQSHEHGQFGLPVDAEDSNNHSHEDQMGRPPFQRGGPARGPAGGQGLNQGHVEEEAFEIPEEEEQQHFPIQEQRFSEDREQESEERDWDHYGHTDEVKGTSPPRERFPPEDRFPVPRDDQFPAPYDDRYPPAREDRFLPPRNERFPDDRYPPPPRPPHDRYRDPYPDPYAERDYWDRRDPYARHDRDPYRDPYRRPYDDPYRRGYDRYDPYRVTPPDDREPTRFVPAETIDYGHKPSQAAGVEEKPFQAPAVIDYGHGQKEERRDSPQRYPPRSQPEERDPFRPQPPPMDRDRAFPSPFLDRGNRAHGVPPPPPPGLPPGMIKKEQKVEVIKVEDILCLPGRSNRPTQIVVLVRGLPGAGKTYVSKLIKDKEVSNGGSAPRMLCLDDYFMIEVDRIEKDPETGKRMKKKVLEYEYEAEMESAYRQNMLKSFKKTIDDGFFPFIIVDAVFDRVKHFDEFWSYAKSKGFQVYVVELVCDVSVCAKRNTHKRTQRELEKLKNKWEEMPKHYIKLDIRSLLQEDSITDVEMEDTDGSEPAAKPGPSVVEEEEDADAFKKSRWELDLSEGNLDKLDGLQHSKRKHSSSEQSSMEEFLQLADEYFAKQIQEPGKKRVRWADLEERKEQSYRRELGFVVGQTHEDWQRITDPHYAERQLNRTKYI